MIFLSAIIQKNHGDKNNSAFRQQKFPTQKNFKISYEKYLAILNNA